MVDPTVPDDDLESLTAALDDPGTDLYDMLKVLADNLTAAVPSFVGVAITLDGVAVTPRVHDSDPALTPGESLDLTFSVLMPDAPDSTPVFYAAEVGAFADLAAVVTRSASVAEHISAGTDVAPLHSGYSLGVSGLAEFSARNQAIGVLIEQGYTPDEARFELRRRATRDKVLSDETAQEILDHLAVTSTRVDATVALGLSPKVSGATTNFADAARPGLSDPMQRSHPIHHDQTRCTQQGRDAVASRSARMSWGTG